MSTPRSAKVSARRQSVGLTRIRVGRSIPHGPPGVQIVPPAVRSLGGPVLCAGPLRCCPREKVLWWRATFGGLSVARWPRLRLPSRLRQPGMNHAVGGWLRAGSGSVGCHETYGGANTRAGADGRRRARVQAARTVACRPAGPRRTAWLARPRLRSRARDPAQCVQPVQADRHM